MKISCNKQYNKKIIRVQISQACKKNKIIIKNNLVKNLR
jgi:hypothetical protein